MKDNHEILLSGSATWPSIDHSLLSPSGQMSKRARKAAMKREAERLFPPGFWNKPVPTEHELTQKKAKQLRRTAATLRELAERGMRRRKYKKEAARLERLAAEIEGDK